MFKKILVPTDVSAPSRRALITALKLANEFNSEVELFHVTYNPQDYMNFAALHSLTISQEQIEESGKAALDTALKDIDVGDIQLSKKHVSGHPATAINEEVKNDVDLVVMGSHGHGPITGALLGSVTQQVLAHTKCPVLVVK